MAKIFHRAALAVAGVYLLAVLLVVFWPTPVDRPAAGILNETLSWLHRHGMLGFVNYNFVEFSANVAMFAPLGLIASVVFKNAWLGIIAGAFGSCLIELGQALLLPSRFASGLDVLANTMGAALGALLFALLTPRWAQKAPADPSLGSGQLLPPLVATASSDADR